MKDLKPVSVASIATVVIAACVVLGLGRVFSVLGPWYFSLEKPAWQPPGFVFPIVWTTLYILIATSAAMAWRTVHTKADGAKLIGLFVVNCVLNVMWSAIFFTLHRPDWALYQNFVFWGSILALILFIWPRHRVAAYLLFPYLLWVSIAITLNFEVVRLNGPFGG